MGWDRTGGRAGDTQVRAGCNQLTGNQFGAVDRRGRDSDTQGKAADIRCLVGDMQGWGDHREWDNRGEVGGGGSRVDNHSGGSQIVGRGQDSLQGDTSVFLQDQAKIYNSQWKDNMSAYGHINNKKQN